MTEQESSPKKKVKEKPVAKLVQEVVEEEQENRDEVITLSTGYRAILRPVSSALISRIAQKITMPEPPMWMNEEKGIEEPNPNNQEYRRELEETTQQRGRAMINLMITMGVDLVDPIPEGDGWLKKLKWMEDQEMVDLSDFDLEDSFSRELLFKTMIAVSGADLETIYKVSGITEEEVEAAGESFPS